MRGRTFDDKTSSPTTLVAGRKNSDSPAIQSGPLRMPAGRGGKTGKRKVSKGMIKRIEGGGLGLMNPMGWYDAEHAETSGIEEPSRLDLPSSHLGRSNDDNSEAAGSAVEAVEHDETGVTRTSFTESPREMPSDL